jgi:hypothetical protein
VAPRSPPPWLRGVFGALAAALGVCGPAAGAGASVDRAWVEVTDRGAEARVVTSAAKCPALSIDGRVSPMRARAAPTAGFPTLVCAAPLPAGAAHVSLKGQPLPTPKGRADKILIFGDTGCRLKGADVQDCNDPRAWPFAALARRAAAHHPDLVIHVGDYWYRESPCPAGHGGCAGSPWGDNWATWDAEFFNPAQPLFAAAPWVMVRGNHEDCSRGGPGWFRLLDAAPAALACPAQSAPMAINVGALMLYVLDSSGTEDRSAPPGPVTAFAAQLDALKADLKAKPGWIVTHRPIWGLAPVARVGPIGPLEVALNATEQAAVRGRDLGAVPMIVSGHIHHFASYSFGPARPAQLIVGTGGDIGEPGDTPKYRAGPARIDGLAANGFAFERYGFLILERAAPGWTGVFYDTSDRIVARCRLEGRALSCAPPARRHSG